MSTGSDVYVSCQSGRGEYPTGGTMGKAFCLFDKLGYVSTYCNYYRTYPYHVLDYQNPEKTQNTFAPFAEHRPNSSLALLICEASIARGHKLAKTHSCFIRSR